jgi:hypothetical protein
MATASWYGLALQGQYGATAARRVDWVGDTIKIMLLTNAYTFNQDTHDFVDDVNANEITNSAGTAYVAGGQALSGKSVGYASGTNTLQLLASNSVWSTASFTAYKGVVYKDTGTATTSPLLGYVDLGGAQTVTSGTFTLQWDATDGVLRIVAT